MQTEKETWRDYIGRVIFFVVFFALAWIQEYLS